MRLLIRQIPLQVDVILLDQAEILDYGGEQWQSDQTDNAEPINSTAEVRTGIIVSGQVLCRQNYSGLFGGFLELVIVVVHTRIATSQRTAL